MQYPNTLPNTKMTLRQLVRPIEVVSPEHSSDDRSHEFQIASQMNACIEFSKAEYARSHQSRIRTLHHFSSFIQICTKPEAFLAHQPKIQDISTILVKEMKKSTFTVPFLGPRGGIKKRDRKINSKKAKQNLQLPKSACGISCLRSLLSSNPRSAFLLL